jgi:hypothetical protein
VFNLFKNNAKGVDRFPNERQMADINHRRGPMAYVKSGKEKDEEKEMKEEE